MLFAKNYEIKCRVKGLSGFKKILLKQSEYSLSREDQTDIYYRVKKGRLKLRIINNKFSHLIYYERSDKNKIRTSNYIISGSKDFKQLDGILRSQFPVLTEVEKRREIFISRNIRIHLDKVVSLGEFIEIEIIYNELKSAKKQMRNLISDLDLNTNDFIKHSYSDMLIKNANRIC